MNQEKLPEATPEPAPALAAAPQPASWEAPAWLRSLIYPLVIWLFLLGVFWQVGRFDFCCLDDPVNVLENRWLRPLSWAGVARFWQKPFAGLYAPVAYTFLAAETWLAEGPPSQGLPSLDPRVFHWGNLCLHLLTTLVVYYLLRQWIAHEACAAIGAALFGLHPLQVESVAWVTESRGLLAGLFGSLALLGYSYWLGPIEASKHRGMGAWLFASVCFLLAILSKPTAAAIPLMAAVIAVGWYRRPARLAAATLGPWMIVAVGIAAWTAQQQPAEAMAFVPPWWARPWIALDAISFYLTKLVLPYRMSVDYGRTPAAVMASGWNSLMWLLPVQVAVVIAFVDDRRSWWTALALMVAGLGPVLGLVPFGFQNYSTVADRYMYLAMLGPALAVAHLAKKAWSPPVAGLALAALAACTFLSYQQVQHWTDSGAILAQALAVNPKSNLAELNIGVALFREKKLDEAEAKFRAVVARDPGGVEAKLHLGQVLQTEGKLAESATYYQEALVRQPRSARGQLNLGIALVQMGKSAEGLAHLEQAREIDPDSASVRAGLGFGLVASGRAAEGLEEFRQAVALEPFSASIRHNLAIELVRLGRPAEAIEHFEAMSAIDPNNPAPYYGLGSVYARLGQPARAIEEYRKALALAPEWVEPANNLAVLLLGHPDAAARKLDEAARWAEIAVRGTKEQKIEPLETLAGVYAAQGKWVQALEAEEKAHALAKFAGDKARLDRIEQRLGALRPRAKAQSTRPGP